MLIYLAMISDPQERADFEQVYKDYQLACLNAALLITGNNRQLAEDALHNAVMNILEKYPHYLKDSCSKLKALFVLIVKREAISIMRKEQIRDHEQLNEYDNDFATGDLPLYEVFEGEETHKEITEAVSKLDDKYKIVFVHRYVYDMKNKEIAVVLGITEKAVSVRLYRAKLQLRELLKSEDVQNE